MGASELKTKRLRLSRPVTTDASGVFAILGDPRTVEHNPSDRLEDRGEATELVERWVRHWEEHGFGYWCVRESGSNRIIGYAGVKWMPMRGRTVLNLVYRFLPEVWGRGFASEAAAAIVSRVLDEMPEGVIVARVRPDNRPSQNVALKAGLQRDATMDCQGEDGLDFAYTSRDVNRRRAEPTGDDHPIIGTTARIAAQEGRGARRYRPGLGTPSACEDCSPSATGRQRPRNSSP